MNALNDYMKVTDTRLKREVVDLDSLRYVMNVLKEIRERESGIDMEIMPVMDMYDMLEQFLPEGYMDTSEMDQKSCSFHRKRMVNKAEIVTDEFGKLQMGFKRVTERHKGICHRCHSFRNDSLRTGRELLIRTQLWNTEAIQRPMTYLLARKSCTEEVRALH